MGEKVKVQQVAVRSNVEVGPGFFLLTVSGVFTAAPAQFYMLRAWKRDPLLSRPFSVFDCTEDGLSFLYAVRGNGTEQLRRLRPGDRITVMGPLGNGWKRSGERIALIGGGAGIAPLFYTARVFGQVDVYLGFQKEPFLVDEFARVGAAVHVASESGNEGHKGLVTDLFQPEGYDACYACGPFSMLAAVHALCRHAGVPLFVSLEERMACGIGACLGCAVRTKRGILRVCREGPVFPAAEVIWDV